MTAVIGILNRHAVALAADSAVTIGGENGNKIFNTANKIFTLSKYHPVAIMIYNAASFIETPWEVIIKAYRDQLEDRYFNSLVEYKDDFLKFLIDNDYFISLDGQKNVMKGFIYNSIGEIINNIASREKLDIQTDSSNHELLFEKLVNEIRIIINNLYASSEELSSFSGYSIPEFLVFSDKCVEEIISASFSTSKNQDVIRLFNELFFTYVKRNQFNSTWSGLVFSGYGASEIFPKLVSIKIAEVIDNRVRYFVDEVHDIGEGKMAASIVPFAQRDVIDTLITGINSDLNDTFIQSIHEFLMKYNVDIAAMLQNDKPVLAKKILNIDVVKIVDELRKNMNEVKSAKHINPTVHTVALLSKEDLAEMAESLIYLTFLKRRISFAEESVGGPVDVALISKGEGFVWIKRKHYFKSDLNPQFFQNYFKPNFIKP